MKNKKGFTLLEVILVIGIIGILMSISTAAFMSARLTARDARRKADLEQIRGALETYKADNNVYPGQYSTPFMDPGNQHPVSDLIFFLVTENNYLSAVPSDPIANVLYRYVPSGNGYYLCASLEAQPQAMLPECSIAVDCGSLSGSGRMCNYSVRNP